MIQSGIRKKTMNECSTPSSPKGNDSSGLYTALKKLNDEFVKKMNDEAWETLLKTSEPRSDHGKKSKKEKRNSEDG
jgi:hypothetical protein